MPRTPIVVASSFAEPSSLALLLVVTLQGAHQLWEFVALAALTGVAAAIGNPAARSLTPRDRPDGAPDRSDRAALDRGPGATIGGPALGGLLFAFSPEVVYAVAIGLLLVSSLVLLARVDAAPLDAAR